MKAYKLLLSISFLSALLFIGACTTDPAPDPEDEYLKKISSTWRIASAQLDGKEVTGSFPQLTLTLNGDHTYSTTHSVGKIWPASGSFTLVATSTDGMYNINRNDGVLLTVADLTATSIKLRFQYTAPPNGRENSVSGQYEFVFNK